MGVEIDNLPTSRRRLLERLKERGPATIAELANDLGLSGEAIRQQLGPIERELWIERESLPLSGEPGRPAGRYRLTVHGERLFPKRHADLAVALIDAVRAELGDETLVRVLGTVTDARFAALAAGSEGQDLDAKVASLRSLYAAEDPFIEIEKVAGGYRIVERNCPYLDVALARPLLCSSTVSVLTRFLGRRVVREERFQDGHGCCAFRVYADQPVDVSTLRFAREPAIRTAPPRTT